MPDDPSPTSQRRIHPLVDHLAAYAWRMIVIGVVVVAALWLLAQVRVVAVPVVIALFLARMLSMPNAWLRRHRWPASLAASTSLIGFLVLLAGLFAIIVPSVADEADSVEPTITAALDDVEDWLVEDSPFDISRDSIDRLRERAGNRVDDMLRSSDGVVLDRATLVAEILGGTILALILTFFVLRDGERFASWAIEQAPLQRRPRLRRAAEAAWRTFGGYLRGATLLGVLEAVVIGVTLLLVGGDLVLPVMVITFVGAYVPLIGAVLAGIVAVLVALVTAGTGPALIVGIVAIVVQQLDNDLLAPYIYGRALSLHPVVILVTVVGGGALFGLAGTMLAVPVVAVSFNAARVLRGPGIESLELPDAGSGIPPPSRSGP